MPHVCCFTYAIKSGDEKSMTECLIENRIVLLASN